MICNVIKNKYKNLNIQVKASLWFLICSFFQKGISFITTPIFTRILTTEEYGQYSVFLSWMNILIIFVTLNLHCGVYAKGLVKFENDKESFSSSMQGLTTTLITIWLIIYFIFRHSFNKIFGLTTNQMLLMLLTMWMTVVFSYWSMSQRMELLYKKLIVITMLTSALKPILSIFLIYLLNDNVLARILGVALTELVFFIWLFLSQMKKGRTFYNVRYWKYALRFNIPLIPHYLSTAALSSSDRILIEKLVGTREAGIYSLAYSISMIMSMLNSALMQTLEPWMYKKIKEKKIKEVSNIAYPAFMIIAFVNLILIAFAPEVVSLFAPKEYHEAMYIIPPIAMSVYFIFSYSFFAIFEFYYEKTKLISIATMCGAILNVILNYITIPIFGYYAAGYTTLICYIVYALLHFIFMRSICKKYLNGEQPYRMRIYLTISGAFVCLGFVLLAMYSNSLLRYLLILGLICLCIIFRKKFLEEFSKIKNN